MAFSQVLKILREQKGLSKSDLARRLDLTPGYIMNIENGTKKPPNEQMCSRIARALDLSVKEQETLNVEAILERVPPNTIDILRRSFGGTQKAPSPNLWKPHDITMHVPVISDWSDVNKLVREEDLPIGGEIIKSDKKVKDSTYGIRIVDETMTPEFNPGDLLVIEQCSAPKDGDFVVAADSKAEKPILRLYKDYGKIRVLHPLHADHKDVVLDNDKRYAIVGRVIKKYPKPKEY